MLRDKTEKNMSLKKKKKKTQANLGEFSKPELISKNRNS
jgi:hypothetical protein